MAAQIKIPWIQDPKTGTGSVSLTLMIISFIMCATALCTKTVDFVNSETLFGITVGLYFGRKLTPGVPRQSDSTTPPSQLP